MPYPEIMIRPMREELTRLGVEELRTPEEVDVTLQNAQGTVMVVVNSICGCAAGRARPGVALALQHEVRPDKVATVFAARGPEGAWSQAGIVRPAVSSKTSVLMPMAASNSIFVRKKAL